MKKQLLLFLLLFACGCTYCQPAGYWQQRVNYQIDVSLNDTAKTLDGYIKMQYYNNSPDTLFFIWIHVWPNAYKNDLTAFSDQLLENGNTEFYFCREEKRGYINRLDFKVDKTAASTTDHPQHQDIIRLLLPKPLAPGNMATIETPFHVKLPYNFSRSGYVNKSFQITQWYPKPAVYDHKGWHEMPYLDQGEFYSEFGAYNVNITVPQDYVVAATGVLKEETRLDTLKTLQYYQDNVHDFAWFADKDLAVMQDTMQLATHTVQLYAYFNKNDSSDWVNSIAFIKSSVRTKSEWLGEYPYDIVSVVESPKKGTGGMEYPTITLVENDADENMLEYLINHEVGHNWFYGIIASNERLHPWMDEGMNSYYDKKYQQELHCRNGIPFGGNSKFIRNRMPDDIENTLLHTATAIKKDQPVESPSGTFSPLNYAAVAYKKSANWMALLKFSMGEKEFDSLMRTYYARWKFKHPYPEDFKLLAEEVAGRNLDSVFALLHTKGDIGDGEIVNCSLDAPTPKPGKKPALAAFFSLKETDKRNYIFLSPAFGYNYYDKFMIGALFHNYSLPPSRFRFFIAPLYAAGSKEVNGLGRLSYDLYPGHKGSRVEIAVAAAKFTVDEFTDSTGKKNYQPFHKIVPSLKYVFANKNPRSLVHKYVQWKTFFITETGLAFSRDTINQVDIITYPKENRFINQLQFVIENNRKLYPYAAVFQAEQGKSFIRLNITANYFFNYAKGGGLNLRFFAGKFFYTKEKTFLTQYETDRYHLNLSGPKGYEDYTYNNYFVGRNEFNGFSNSQIMNRDGAFKVKTDLLADKLGKTDDWLSAVNLNSTVPKQVNPLELLPIPIRLKLFVDIGTYAEAWKDDAPTSRFLYDAGFQLSFFKDIVNVYFPLFYSKAYRNYFKSTYPEKLFKETISFSIDIQHISTRKFFPQIPF